MIAELAGRWVDELLARPWWLAIAVLIAITVALRTWDRRGARALLSLLIVAGAVAWAWSLLWASDDAFITFRYAEHFARGDGLVFNVGERVEGYTDFLWALIIAAAIALGARC